MVVSESSFGKMLLLNPDQGIGVIARVPLQTSSGPVHAVGLKARL